jgi:hypothetical protein
MARIFIEKSEETLLALKKINWAMLSGFGLLLLSSNLFPWAALPKFFNFLQFPWRFYALASLFLAVSIGLMYEVMSRKQYRRIGLFLLLLFMCAFAVNVTNNSAKYTKVDDSYFQNAVNTYPIDGYEYLPKPLKADKIRSLTIGGRKVVADDGSFLSYTQSGLTLTVDYTMWFEYIDIPLLYYKGYSAWFVNVHGGKTPLEMDKEQHTIRVYTTDASETGSIVVEYSGTTLQLVSNILTLAFVFGLCANGCVKRKGSKGTNLLLVGVLRV